MDDNYFQKIIDKSKNSDFFIYNQIPGENITTKTFIITDKYTKQKYFYKQIINKTRDEFNFINKTIYELIKLKIIKTPNLIYSNYDSILNISHQIFEFIKISKNIETKKTNSFIYFTQNLEQILFLIKQFHKFSKAHTHILTKNLDLEKIKIQNRFNKKLSKLPNSLKEIFKEELTFKYNSKFIIINDINPSNFLSKNNEIYLIDFDDMELGSFEYDFSKIYINLYFENSQTKKSFINFSEMMNNPKFNIKFDSTCLINLIIINLIQKIYLDYIKYKIINKNMLNRLIEIKTNKFFYINILNGQNT